MICSSADSPEDSGLACRGGTPSNESPKTDRLCSYRSHPQRTSGFFLQPTTPGALTCLSSHGWHGQNRQRNCGWRNRDLYRAMPRRSSSLSRLFELQPKSRTAAGASISLIPADGIQRETLMAIGDSQRDSETIEDMKALALVGDKFPANLAKAILICRESDAGLRRLLFRARPRSAQRLCSGDARGLQGRKF